MDLIRDEAKKLFRQELARRSFWDFCLYYDPDLFEARSFLKEVADAFQEITSGTIKSLSVSLPPRAGKSYITSLYCAWSLGNNPTESVMRNTCTATLYAKFADEGFLDIATYFTFKSARSSSRRTRNSGKSGAIIQN